MDGQSYAVTGAGIVGAAVARQLLDTFPHAYVTVIEKEFGPAHHQTGHNSGVVHAGLYYEPGSLKARLCRRGVELVRSYTAEHGLPYEQCGKILVALTEEEEGRLRDIHATAVANEVPGVRLLTRKEISEIEPNATGRLALHSPETAITDYAAIARHLLEHLDPERSEVRYAAEVTAMENRADRCRIGLGEEFLEVDHVIVCAGIHTDELSVMAGGARYPRMVPFFGQYRQLAPQYRDITRGLVYPVPDPAYPFLGVHLTKRVDGEMLIGPNAFFSLGKENYSGFHVGVGDTLRALADLGFWRFAAGNLSAAGRELKGIVSARGFVDAAARYVPKVRGAKTQPIARGIRAQAMDAKGGLVDDFVIERVRSATLVRNAPSPGATSALAIAEHIVGLIAEDVAPGGQ